MQRRLPLFFLLSSLSFGFRTDCHRKPFRVTYPNNLLIKGISDAGNDCLPEYISSLICSVQGKVVFRPDSLQEFEFGKRPWPRIVRLNPRRYQFLLEQNNRPNKNNLLLLTIDGSRLMRQQVLPTFDSPPSNVDADKALEYAGILNYSEGLSNPAKSNCNPILFYEVRSSGWVLDSAATIQVNRKLWGGFYGFHAKPNVILKTPKSFNTYLPAIPK